MEPMGSLISSTEAPKGAGFRKAFGTCILPAIVWPQSSLNSEASKGGMKVGGIL